MSLTELRQQYDNCELDPRVVNYLESSSWQSRNSALTEQEKLILQGSIARMKYDTLANLSSQLLPRAVTVTTLKINGAKLFEWLSEVLGEEVTKTKISRVYQDLLSSIDQGITTFLTRVGDNITSGGLFYGRTKELEDLDRYCKVSPIVSIVGLPGIGKSSFVRRYLSSKSEASAKVWISDCQTFFEDVNKSDQNLEGFYIFDPFDKELLCEYGGKIEHIASKPNVNIILISTEPLRGFSSHLMLTLKGLPIDEAVQIPVEFGFNDDCWKQIVQALGGHPRFIRQYASWVDSKGLSQETELLTDTSVQAGYFDEEIADLLAKSVLEEDRKLLRAVAESDGLTLVELLKRFKRSARRIDVLTRAGILDEQPSQDGDSTIQYIVPAIIKKYIKSK